MPVGVIPEPGGRLIQYAETGPIREAMGGPLRDMACRVADRTGFRVDEPQSLSPESVWLAGAEPNSFPPERTGKVGVSRILT
jgi:hypothetical protein